MSIEKPIVGPGKFFYLLQATISCWFPVLYKMDVDLRKAFITDKMQEGLYNSLGSPNNIPDFYTAVVMAIVGINADLVDTFFFESKTVPELILF
jgi:hypothetical protein